MRGEMEMIEMKKVETYCGSTGGMIGWEDTGQIPNPMNPTVSCRECPTPEGFDYDKGGTWTCKICGYTKTVMPMKPECGCDCQPCEHTDWTKHEADYIRARAKIGVPTPDSYLFHPKESREMAVIEVEAHRANLPINRLRKNRVFRWLENRGWI